ncbi:MAG TPA: GNAT family N-acetyltransferase [Vicinamibacterales bacterium]|nr:GNAT family N-acetyltransferase [Vicinamibacterales bacterium]
MRTARESGRLRLRTTTSGDLPFLLRLYASTRVEELDLTDWDAATRAAFVEMQFRAQRTHYLTHFPDAQCDVVELEGIDIGRLYVRRSGSDIVLMDIALLPAYRSAGIGSELLRALLNEASSSGRAVVLHVEANNPRAHDWYQRSGFVDVSSSGVHTLMRRDPA